MASQQHVGPLLVQRPFYPEGPGTCHVYILHPPGGVAGGDRLHIETKVERGAEVLLTTPAASKFYRTGGESAEQTHILSVAAGGCLEWLPQEGIAFRGARVRMSTQVHLEPGARFVGWDILCLGRPASGERFDNGTYFGNWEIWRGGRRVFTERARYSGGGEPMNAPWGLARYPVVGTLVAACEDEALAVRLRDAGRAALGEAKSDCLFGITCLKEVLVARYIGLHSELARKGLTRVWAAIRGELLGKQPIVPRIWYT